MKKRTIILSVIITIAIGSLVAVAAIGASGPATISVTPGIHRVGQDGYFLINLPLPKDAPKGALTLTAQAEEGNVFLLNAFASVPQPVAHDKDGEGENETFPNGTITVTGRFITPGTARLTILARPTGEEFKPLLKLVFTLPATDRSAPAVRTAWARQQQIALAMADPDSEDSFSQYWNLAIAPRYGLSPELREGVTRFRREPPDLYSVFTGAAAIQESLQMELLGNGLQSATQRETIKKAGTRPDTTVPLAGLMGPTVKSHPFKEMLKGKDPQLPPLASFIPQDQYAVFFTDINKQIELADLMDEWGGNLLHQVETSAHNFRVREKVSRQLCLENSLLTRWFGDRVVADMAFSGSDPFLKEGTAFTVLFSLKDRERFQKQLEKQYSEATANGAARSKFTIDGLHGSAVVSPDRRISSYALVVGKVAIVSTSKEALERIVAVQAKRLPSLAQADDFRYMRTIFAQSAAEEDIFIYLSDAHIRNLVGPRAKIGEARRMRCAGNMALIANARLWFKIENQREPTMAELVDGGYLGKTPPSCPDHGSYGIDKNGEVYCSLHNRPGLLTPVAEVPLEQATTVEAAQYRAFVENYNRYWTRFFDPIGIRVKMGRNIRVQTCILPLIENSWYDGLAAFSGRTPGELTESALLPRTVVSLRGHLAQEWLQNTGLMCKLTEQSRLNLGWLGDELSLNLCDGQVLFSAGGGAMGLLGQEVGRSSSLEPLVIGYLGSALNLPTYLAVKVTDPKKAQESIPALFHALAPNYTRVDDFSVETYSLEDHRGKPLYVANFNIWLIKLRLYAAVVDDRLVIASRRDVVTELMDADVRGKGKKSVKQEGNFEMAIYRSAFKQLEEVASLGFQEDLRHSCLKNLPLAAIMLKSLGLPADSFTSTTVSLRGFEPYCPSGGRYQVDPKTGIVACSVHGTRFRPRQPAAGDQTSPTIKLVNSLERINARLAFTPDGLMTTVDIQRKSTK